MIVSARLVAAVCLIGVCVMGQDTTPPPTDPVVTPPTLPPSETAVPPSTLPPTDVAVPPPTLPPTDAAIPPTEGQVPPPSELATEPPTPAAVPTAVQPPIEVQQPTAVQQPTVVQLPTDTAVPQPTEVQPPQPTAVATEPPVAAAEPTAPLPCFTSLSTLDEVERNTTNIDVERNYVLCANTTFFTGFLTTNGDILGGDKPLTLRKNMHIYCGEIGGGSENNCVISRGSFGLTSIPNNFDPPTFNNNVIVQGVTFENAALFAVLVALAGEFQFIDCKFINHQSADVPVRVEWDGGTVGGGDTSGNVTDGGNTGGNVTDGGDTGGNVTDGGNTGGGDTGGGDNGGGDTGGGDTGGNVTGGDTGAGGVRNLKSPQGRYDYLPLQKNRAQESKEQDETRDLQTATTLRVEFIDCVFQDCECAPDSRLGLVNLAGDGIDVSFTSCLFQDNNYNVDGINDASAYGVIVENLGEGSVSFNSTCFVGNRAHGNGLVASYSTELPSVSNDFGVDNEVVYLTELKCEFVALVDGNDAAFPNIACANFTADTCSFEIESPPTSTEQPSVAPVAPTMAEPTESMGGAAQPTVAPPPNAVPTSSASIVRFAPGVLVGALLAIAMVAA